MSTPTLTIYYDGLCPLCSREIAYYRRRAAGDAGVVFADITAAGFDAAAHGLDAARVHQVMHVKEGEAAHTGLDAFVAIWRRVGPRWAARVATLPGIYAILNVGYWLFARLRPLLPRRKPACDTGACQR